MDTMRVSKRTKKLLVVMALAAVFEGGVSPSAGGYLGNGFSPEELGPENLQYITSILKEHRTGLGVKEEERLARVILGESYAYSIDPIFVLALIKTESTFFNWSRSMKGAVGLMQILPPTGKSIAKELGFKWEGEDTLFNPYKNVKMGIHYYSRLRGRYKNDTRKSLAAYNFGPISEDAYVPRAFANRVLANYMELKERAGYLN